MKVGIMQPYFLPYIGYFHLIKSVDKFIFYDDVNYIKGGWINRNRLIVNNSVNYITINLQNASKNKLINEINILDNRIKLFKTVQQAYKKAPYYLDAISIFEDIVRYKTESISILNIYSTIKVCEYLNLDINYEVSSLIYPESRGLEKSERLKRICLNNSAHTYINVMSGQHLYSKEDFRNNGIELLFIQSQINEYKQFNNVFIPGLSILDVMMFNSKNSINNFLNNYKLI